MSRLKKSKALQRCIRQDKITELGIPTATLAIEAMKAGDIDEAQDLIEYAQFEGKKMHDASVSVIDDTVTYLAHQFGEEEVAKFWRESFYPRVKAWLAPSLSVEEVIQKFAEDHRGHGANVTITEEEDRYVLKLDPCGSGGKLWQAKENVGLTKEAHTWAWNKKGIPYYCIHCCIACEMIATELRGYPMNIVVRSENPDDPCISYFYKKPELIPQEYYSGWE
jgi:hypothetical protein